jgi:hypothetical protein
MEPVPRRTRLLADFNSHRVCLCVTNRQPDAAPLERQNGTVLDLLSILDGPANRELIDSIIGSLSGLRKRHDEPPDQPIWLALQTSRTRFPFGVWN